MALARTVHVGDEAGGWGQFANVEANQQPTSGAEEGKKLLSTKFTDPISVQTSVSSLNSRQDSGHQSCPDFGSLSAARSRVLLSGITFSEAKGEIWKERLRGPLLKRGFRHRKLWVARWVVLSGRMLTYFVRPQDETSDHQHARGSLELTSETVVSYEEHDSGFGFMVFPTGVKNKRAIQDGRSRDSSVTSPSSVDLIPIADHEDATHSTTVDEEEDSNGGSYLSCGSSTKKKRLLKPPSNGKPSKGWFSSLFGSNDEESAPEVWCFRARSASERETWVRAIQRVVALIRRVEMAPTLVGVGPMDHHYELKHDIGVGRFGTVKLAVARTTGNLFAVKILNRGRFANSPDLYTAINAEIRVMRKVTRLHDHPNICKSYHLFQENLIVYIFMEYLGGGSLMDRVHRKGHFSESEASYVIFQIASALKELHSSGIVLCDLNPVKLLFEREDSDTVKVVEFGRALVMPGPVFASQNRLVASEANQQQEADSSARKKRNPQTSLSSFVTNQQVFGLPGYIAPEILSHKQYSTACDIYSLGCVAFFMLTGSSPLLGGDSNKPPPRSALDQVLTDAGTSAEARDLIAGMTTPDRTRRFTASQVLDHPWVKSPPRRPDPEAVATLSPMVLSSNDASKESPARKKLKGVIHLVHFCIRLFRLAKMEVIARAPPPLIFNLIDSRRSTDTTSSGGVSNLELRNQWLTLDGYAQRVRSENRLDELSPIFKLTGPARVNSSASGFTAVGISSSVAGQLSELGVDSAESREPVRAAGPFLAALEAHLEAEAGYGGSTTSDEEAGSKDDDDVEDDDDGERVATTSIASNPQGPSKFEVEEKMDDVVVVSHQGSDKKKTVTPPHPAPPRLEEEEEEPVSPNTARESAVRAWKAMVLESQREEE